MTDRELIRRLRAGDREALINIMMIFTGSVST